MDVRGRLLGSNGQYSRYPMAYFLAEMERLGFHGLDFVPQTPHFWCAHTGIEEPGRLKAALDEAGLQLATLTPPHYRYSITAVKGCQREATFRYYQNAITLAHALGGDRVVLGAAGACWDLDGAQLHRQAVSMLRSLCSAAEEAEITLLLCPVMGSDTPLIAQSPILGRAAEIASVLEELSHPRLGAALDTNVMSACGETIGDWFGLLGDQIALVCLTDGNYHGWRAWGDGCLPMMNYLEELEAVGYLGDISLRVPGDHYVESPAYPDERALRAISEGGGVWQT